MVGAFRLQPAIGRLDRAIRRPRLVQTLQARFDHRLTVVAAPAGAGKSTALVLAVESNRVDPIGEDLWLGVDKRDNDSSQLLNGLCQAVGIEVDSTTTPKLEMVTDEIWRRAPTDVALIVDDVHFVTSDASTELLTELVATMPANGHVVLVGRSEPVVPTARLRAHGELLTIGPDDLELDDLEVGALVASRVDDSPMVGDLDIAVLSRHAALADLRLAAGSGAQVSFLEEEVLGALAPQRLHALARVSVLAEFDDELTDAISDGQFSASDLVAGLPLVDDAGNGSYRLHALLRSAVQDRLSEAEQAEVARTAARVEENRNNLPYAIDLLGQGGDVEGGAALARLLCAMPLLRRSYSELLSVHRFLRVHQPTSSLTALYEHQYQSAQLDRVVSSTESIALLQEIAAHARRENDPTVEAIAIFRIISLQDSEAVEISHDLFYRLVELGEVDAVARSLRRQTRCAEAGKRGEIAEALAWLDDEFEADPVIETVYLSVRLCDLGRPEEVGVGLSPENLQDLPAGAEIIVAFALWLRGEATPELASVVVADMVVATLPRRVIENSVSLLGAGIFINIAAGELSTAKKYVDRGEGLVELRGTARNRQFMMLGRAAIASVDRSDAEASEILSRCLAEIPIESWPSRHHLLCLSFIYVAAPETREVLDICEFGRSLTVSIRAGRALVAMRGSGSTVEAARLPWAEPLLLRVQVLPHHLCELAIGAMSAGNSEAREVLGQLPNLPRLLARVVETATELVRVAAERQLNRFPPEPTSDIRIVTLGAMELWRDGELVQDDDWLRRRRVRELLAYLVDRRSVQRTEVAATLWPDLDTAKAASNLRVNLSYLQKVLEPNRPSGSAAFYVQAEGERLVLHSDTNIDTDNFEQWMADALAYDRTGAPGMAFDLYQESLALHGGSFLADFDVAWCEDNRVRFDSLALGGCCRVGELIAAKGEPEEALQLAIRALRISELAERAGRLFANCLLAMRDRSAAHQSLLALVAKLESVGLTPEPETKQLLTRLAS